MAKPSETDRKGSRRDAAPERVGTLPRIIVGGLFIVGLVAVAVFVSTTLRLIANYVPIFHPDRDITQLKEYQFVQLLKDGKVKTIVNENDPAVGSHTLAGAYLKPGAPNSPEIEGRYRVPLDLEEDANLVTQIERGDFGPKRAIETRVHTPLVQPLLTLLMPVLAGLVIGLVGFYLLYRLLTDFLLAFYRSV